jgi:mannitol/fructose-specific phosphotransferase system IIA component (Ntr-type)
LRKRGELVREEEIRNGAIILGASPFSCLLGKEIEKYEPVTIIDSSEAHCRYARKCGLNVIQKNVLHTETLDILQSSSKRFFLALSGNATVNQFAAIEAKNYFSIPEIYTSTLFNDEKESVKMFEFKQLFSNAINLNQWSAFIYNKKVQTIDLGVRDQGPLHTFLLHEGIREPYLVLFIIRKQKIHQMGSLDHDFMLFSGDVLKVLQPTTEKFQLMHNFKELLAKVPILDFDEPIESKDYFQAACSIISEIVKIDSDTLLNYFIQEEKLGNPSFAPGIAIPHIMVEQEVPFSVVVARCKKGISNWSTVGEPKIIFTIVTSSLNRNIHLHFLSNIAQILNDPEFEQAWLAAKSKENLRDVLLKRVSPGELFA